MRALVFALAYLLVGCAAALDPPLESLPLVPPTLAVTVHGDARFTAEERRECEQASLALSRFTRGRARISIVWDVDDLTYLDAPLPMLYRSPRSPETGDFGGVTKDRIVRLVPETCRERSSLQACAQHEFGHLLGFEHVGVAGQVMSPRNPSLVFGVADYGECIRVGACVAPRRPDVTTVTLTIDPAVPPVQPEYP